MQRFWSVFGLFSDRSRGTPSGGSPGFAGSPSPSKSPPEGGKSAPPRGGGVPPPCPAVGLPFDPPGAPPPGVPPASPAPPPASVWQRSRASEARRGGSPGEGVGKKSKWWRRSRPPGRQRWKCGEGRAAGGQGWGQPVGSPRAVHGVSLLLSTGREAPAGRVAISTSPPLGGPTRPPLGACFCPAGLTTSVQEV